MRNLFKKFTAVSLSLTLAVGMTGAVSAAVKKGTDVSNGKSWTSYSIHGNNKEDGGKWETALKDAGQFYNTNVTKESGKDSHKAYGENAKISTQTSSSFTMDVTSTGWSADYHPFTGALLKSNPWGVTATKVVNVERGRYYTISYQIKSNLSNEITKEEKRSNGTYYNVGTGNYNYIKHIHFKAYDNTDTNGAALKLSGTTAKIGGKSVLEKGNKNFDSFIKLDSKNITDDGWVTVSAKVYIPSEKADYQSKKSTPTLGIKFAFGAFIQEYPNEVNMSGKIQIRNFSIKADDTVKKPGKPTVKSASKKMAAKSLTISLKKKVSGVKGYQYAVYKTKSNAKKAKSSLVKKTNSKTKLTVNSSKLKNKKTLYVTARAYKKVNGFKVYGKWSSPKKVRVKK